MNAFKTEVKKLHFRKIMHSEKRKPRNCDPRHSKGLFVSCYSPSGVQKWFGKFRSGDFSPNDQPRPRINVDEDAFLAIVEIGRPLAI